MFGVGYLLWSQAFLMLSSHFLRLSMMDLSFIAPGLVVLPLQARLLALPPPTSITLLAIGPNNPFLAFFFPPVVLYFWILLCWTKKFVILVFTIFISFTAISRHVAFTARPQGPVDLPPLADFTDFLTEFGVFTDFLTEFFFLFFLCFRALFPPFLPFCFVFLFLLFNSLPFLYLFCNFRFPFLSLAGFSGFTGLAGLLFPFLSVAGFPGLRFPLRFFPFFFFFFGSASLCTLSTFKYSPSSSSSNSLVLVSSSFAERTRVTRPRRMKRSTLFIFARWSAKFLMLLML